MIDLLRMQIEPQRMPLIKLLIPTINKFFTKSDILSLTVPALALTTSVPAFCILSVSDAISSSVNDTSGDV